MSKQEKKDDLIELKTQIGTVKLYRNLYALMATSWALYGVSTASRLVKDSSKTSLWISLLLDLSLLGSDTYHLYQSQKLLNQLQQREQGMKEWKALIKSL